MAVIKKMIPNRSFNTGMIGLLSLYLSSRLNISNYSLKAQYLALNLLSSLLTFLLPLYFSKHPASELPTFLESSYLTDYPSLINIVIASTSFSFVFFIWLDFLGLGRCLNSLIMSMGRAKSPTPPKMTKKIHPKKERMAIMQTAKDTSNFMIFSATVPSGTLLPTLTWLSFKVISVTGNSTNFKNAQLMNKIITEIAIAPNVQHAALRSLLQMVSSSSVSQKKIAQGMSRVTKMRTTMYRKNQKAIMSRLSARIAERLATSRGTMRAWAWQRVSPTTTKILQQTAVPHPLSSGWIQSASRQILTASRMIVMTTIRTMRQASMSVFLPILKTNLYNQNLCSNQKQIAHPMLDELFIKIEFNINYVILCIKNARSHSHSHD